MSSAIDLEAQQVAQAASCAKEAGGVEMHEIDILGSRTINVASPLRSVSTGQDINNEAHPVVSQAEGSGGGGDAPQRNITSDKLTQGEAQIPVARIPTLDPGPRNTTSDSGSKEPHMVGDFDGSASEFWKLFENEAKNNDDAQINTLKEGMESALIFAGLFSAVLTAFVVDSKQSLKPSPSDETIYYLRQHSTILSQISVQLSSIAPQVAIPSTPPPPFPPFSPLASDIRINVFWFMALVFSLLAALLAILVQQWVRNYMYVFQRYDNPLKCSRLRQYLYEGCEKWKMPRLAEVVPGFLHVSLFLFFAGLGNSLLNINTKVALSTIVPIGVSGLLYIFMIFAPIIHPETPYQNSFSSILWYLIQTSHGRKFRDHGGKMKPVSANMADGQMELAMEETVARKDRDERATRWLITNLTEDAEMEKFLPAIPGSFNTAWGTEVWKRVGEDHESGDQSQDEPVARPHEDTTAHRPSSSWSIRSVIRPIVHLVRRPTPRHPTIHATIPNVHPHSTTTHIQREKDVYELSTRVARSVEMCNNQGLFANDDLWRRRTRACIETTASLVFCANAKLAWFGGVSELLRDIGSSEKIQKMLHAGTDELFMTRWACLSLVSIRPILEDNTIWQDRATLVMESYAKADDTGNDDALTGAQRTIETLKKANGCLYRLYDPLRYKEDLSLTEEVKEILRGHESEISELEQINIEADRLEWVDYGIFDIQNAIYSNFHQIISQFSNILDGFDPDQELIPTISRIVDESLDTHKLQFICPSRTLKSMCSPALRFRNILEGQGDADAYKELLKNLKDFPFWPSSGWRGDQMVRQLWRVQDLRDGGGLGFTVELFFILLSQLLSTSSSKVSHDSHPALYMGTFRAITSEWGKYKDSLGTQKLFLNTAISRRQEFDISYPAYIIDEFLLLLGNVFKGQTGPHIDEAMQEFESHQSSGGRFTEQALTVLRRGQARSPAS